MTRRDATVILHPQTFAACDDFVGRAPWPAADPLVGLLGRSQSRTRGSGADEGVRPTFWLRRSCHVGQAILPADALSSASKPAAAMNGPTIGTVFSRQSLIKPFVRRIELRQNNNEHLHLSDSAVADAGRDHDAHAGLYRYDLIVQLHARIRATFE
jgi:hypothetical protein